MIAMEPANSSQKHAASDTEDGHVPHWAPAFTYVLIALATLGLAAFTSSANMIADQPNKDIWQHIASVRALMENLAAPQNPFVVSPESSRHFQPLWVATAAVGNALGLTVWQAMTGAAFAVMAILGVAIYVFARAYFVSPWAPSVLLFVILFAWGGPFLHTGLHSAATLHYGAGYPATFMIALSLLQWATVLRALEDRRYLVVLVLLSALMLATHQLGAVIGFIGAASFAAAQPGARPTRRLSALAAIIMGGAAALVWPYYNPAAFVLRAGYSTWEGGLDFYSSPWMPGILLPAGLGLLWMRHREARPLALALILFSAAFLLGLFGVQIASRFLMPVLLILHVGLAGLMLEAMSLLNYRGPAVRMAPWLAAAGVITFAAVRTAEYQSLFKAEYLAAPGIYSAAERLTRDVPDDEQIAAVGLTAWPVVATGQRVLSVPWPEPAIANLRERQEMTDALFDPALSSQARRDLAAELGIRVLIADRRYLPPGLLLALEEASVSTSQDGMLHRFNLSE